MLEKYRQLIYKNPAEIKNLEKKCWDNVVKSYPVELNIDDESRKQILEHDYNSSVIFAEGQMLFELAAQKFGNKLWSGNAWKNKSCRTICPLGNMCKKNLVQIDNECFCYGQLYHQKITDDELILMAENNHSIKIIKADGKIHIDLNDTNNEKIFSEQIFSAFFFSYQWFIWWFGDNGGKGKVNGINVINKLLQKNNFEKDQKDLVEL